jgi:hypothetical protein
MKREELIDMISSWQNLDLLSRHITDHPEYLGLLVEVALDDSKPEYWRAAWMVDKINVRDQELIKPYLPALFKALKKTRNLSKMRHFLKIITFHQIPVKQQGFLFDFCMTAYTSQSIPVAVRAHALQILYQIAQDEPGLKPELAQIVEHELSLGQSAGIRARGKKILSLLYREN